MTKNKRNTVLWATLVLIGLGPLFGGGGLYTYVHFFEKQQYLEKRVEPDRGPASIPKEQHDGLTEEETIVLLAEELAKKRNGDKQKDKNEPSQLSMWLGIFGTVNTTIMGWVMAILKYREHKLKKQELDQQEQPQWKGNQQT